MIFLSPFLDITRVYILTVSFLAQVDSGILCLENTFLWPMILVTFSLELTDIFFGTDFLYSLTFMCFFSCNSMTHSGCSALHGVNLNFLKKDNLLLQLPILTINEYEIKRSSSIKFIAVLVDENLIWTHHITIVEHKFKNLGLINKQRSHNKYVLFLHAFLLNYGNTVWCST